MELLATLGASLLFGVGGAWISRDAQMRRRLHVWLWPPAAMWGLMLILAWALASVEESGRDWAVLGLNCAFLAVSVAVLAALLRTLSSQTWWFVIPYLIVTSVGAAYTWLMGYMGIQDVWL